MLHFNLPYLYKRVSYFIILIHVKSISVSNPLIRFLSLVLKKKNYFTDLLKGSVFEFLLPHPLDPRNIISENGWVKFLSLFSPQK